MAIFRIMQLIYPGKRNGYASLSQTITAAFELLAHLHLVKLLVQTVSRKQFAMVSHVADLPLLQTEDRIRFPYRGEAVGDENNDFVRLPFEEPFHDEHLVFGVELAGAFVENQDLTVLQDHPDYHDELPLPAGEIDIPTQGRIEPEPERPDLFREPEIFEELPEDFVGGRARHPEQEIFPDGKNAVENERILADNGSHLSKTGPEDGTDFRIVVLQRPVVFGKKPEYLVYQRGFARAVLPDDSVYPSFAEFDRDIPEHDGRWVLRFFPEVFEHVEFVEVLIVRFRRILLDAIDGDVDELQFFLNHLRIAEGEAFDSNRLDFFLKFLLFEGFPMCRDREKDFEFPDTIGKRAELRYDIHQIGKKVLDSTHVHDTHRHQPHAAGSRKNRVSDDAFDDCARYPLIQHIHNIVGQFVQHGLAFEFDTLSQSCFCAFQHGVFRPVHSDMGIFRFQFVGDFPQLMFQVIPFPQLMPQPVSLLDFADFRADQQGYDDSWKNAPVDHSEYGKYGTERTYLADHRGQGTLYGTGDSRTGRAEFPEEAIISLRERKAGFDQQEFFVNSKFDIGIHLHFGDTGQVIEGESDDFVKEVREEDYGEDDEEYPIRRPVHELEQLGIFFDQLVGFQFGEIRDTNGYGARYQRFQYPYCQEPLVLEPDNFFEKIQGSCA